MSLLDEVTTVRRHQAQDALDLSVRTFERSLQQDLYFLTSFFAPERAASRRDVADLYGVWLHGSDHSAAIRRLLFYQVQGTDDSAFFELTYGEPSAVPVVWTKELEVLRERIQRLDFRPGQRVEARWLRTWMFYPDSDALVRPFGSRPIAEREGRVSSVLTGFLVLQVDWNYVAEQVVRRQIARHFRGEGPEPAFDVAIFIDGNPVLLHEAPEEDSRALASLGSRAARTEEAAPHSAMPDMDSDWLEEADAQRRLILSASSVPPAAARRGAIQRVAVWRPTRQIAQAESGARPIGTEGLPAIFSGAVFNGGHEPRLFLAGSKPMNVRIAARHTDGSLEAAVNALAERSRAMGFGVLALLGLAMALAAVSAKNASNLANERLNFVAAVSHELRTPLAVIRTIADNIASGLVGKDRKTLQYGDLLSEQAKRLSNMLEQTLQHASMESGGMQCKLRELAVDSVADEVLDDLREDIERSGFTVERARGEAVPSVRADAQALRQSLANLLTNALKYGRKAAWVRLETTSADTAHGEEVRISVHDRGEGIPAGEADSIFSAYFRGSSAAKTRVSGTGLGLKLAHDMVCDMGGRLSVRSRPGQGSVFTIHLPAHGVAEPNA